MAETLLKPLKAGLIGAGIQASLTPAMHMKEGAAQGLSLRIRADRSQSARADAEQPA
jgi:shikimate 5-dehydrogenase